MNSGLDNNAADKQISRFLNDVLIQVVKKTADDAGVGVEEENHLASIIERTVVLVNDNKEFRDDDGDKRERCTFEEMLQRWKDYCTKNNTKTIPKAESKLSGWVKEQRKASKKFQNKNKSTMTKERMSLLERAGFIFKPETSTKESREEKKGPQKIKNSWTRKLTPKEVTSETKPPTHSQAAPLNKKGTLTKSPEKTLPLANAPMEKKTAPLKAIVKKRKNEAVTETPVTRSKNKKHASLMEGDGGIDSNLCISSDVVYCKNLQPNSVLRKHKCAENNKKKKEQVTERMNPLERANEAVTETPVTRSKKKKEASSLEMNDRTNSNLDIRSDADYCKIPQQSSDLGKHICVENSKKVINKIPKDDDTRTTLGVKVAPVALFLYHRLIDLTAHCHRMFKLSSNKESRQLKFNLMLS